MSHALVLLGVLLAIGQEALAAPGEGTRRVSSSDATLRRLALIAGLLLFASTAVAVLGARSSLTATIGAALVALGGWLRAAAMRNLGPHFRTEAGADALVTTGIHGLMRHPSELGLIAWLLGLLIAAPGWLAAALVLVQLGLLAWRLQIEESALAEQFGAAWLRYAARTPALGL